MAIYVFSLISGFSLGGMDYAQGVRYKYLKKISQPVKYVYTNIPTEYSIRQYEQIGIKAEDTLSAHFYMCGKGEIEEISQITDKSYYSKGRLTMVEHYADRLLYTDYYTIDDHGNQSVQPVKKVFRRADGTVAYDLIYDENGNERYLFSNGENISKQEFLCKFIQQLHLTQEDIALIDRGGHAEFAQPLFAYGNRAKLITFFHDGHYAEKGEASEYLYLNYEYYYWFKYSYMLHTIIVSTDVQREELIDKLKEYGCSVPEIEVIPASGLDTLYTPTCRRKPCSLLTVSRLDKRKRIDWVIRSVIQAHEECPDISLDIYGKGGKEITQSLHRLVKENHADAYIRFMGHCDMTGRYMEYEAYVSASLGETLGLSIMEASGSGNALIGLDVKYGNKIFIRNGENGYLTDFDFSQIDDEKYVEGVIRDMAGNIVRLFSDPEKLASCQKRSYQIAENYLEHVIEEQWIRFLERVIAKTKCEPLMM